MSCNHKTGYWKNVESYNDWTGETESTSEFVEDSLYVDIDLHRYKCTRCHEVGYYSGRAKLAFEGKLPMSEIY